MSATQPLRTGVVLTGGGAKGAYQIGCLRALQDAGLSPLDAISGASVGAIHGVMLAAGRLDEAEAIWLRARLRDVAAVATRRLWLFPLWLLAGLASEFSPLKVWRLSDSVTHPVRWRRFVYPLACLAAALGLWSVRRSLPAEGVVVGFAIAFAACAALALAHEWLRPHFLGSSPISQRPLVATIEQAVTEEDCARIRSQGIPVYATTSDFHPYTPESVLGGGWAPRYVRLDWLDRASLIEVLLRGLALPGFAGSPDRSAATVVDGSWADNVPAAPLLFDGEAAVGLLFVIYLKPRFRHEWRHNSLVGLVSMAIRDAVSGHRDDVAVNLRLVGHGALGGVARIGVARGCGSTAHRPGRSIGARGEFLHRDDLVLADARRAADRPGVPRHERGDRDAGGGHRRYRRLSARPARRKSRDRPGATAARARP